MPASLAPPAASPPTTKRHRRHARQAAKTHLTPATSLYCDSQPTSAPSSPPSEGERPSQASKVSLSSAALRTSGASGPYLPSATTDCGTAVAASEAGAGRTSPQDKAPAGPLSALHTPGPSPWTPSVRRPSLDLAILLGPVSPSVAATAAAASGASSAYDRMQTSPYTPAGRAQALSPCICTPGRTQAAAMSPAAAAAATRCSPLYTSGLKTCVMSCKVRPVLHYTVVACVHLHCATHMHALPELHGGCAVRLNRACCTPKGPRGRLPRRRPAGRRRRHWRRRLPLHCAVCGVGGVAVGAALRQPRGGGGGGCRRCGAASAAWPGRLRGAGLRPPAAGGADEKVGTRAEGRQGHC